MDKIIVDVCSVQHNCSNKHCHNTSSSSISGGKGLTLDDVARFLTESKDGSTTRPCQQCRNGTVGIKHVEMRLKAPVGDKWEVHYACSKCKQGWISTLYSTKGDLDLYERVYENITCPYCGNTDSSLIDAVSASRADIIKRSWF